MVVDNGGGGIFSFLPQRDSLDQQTFERLFATPQVTDVARVAHTGSDWRWWRSRRSSEVVGAIRDAASSGTTSVRAVSVEPGRRPNVGITNL